MSTATPEVFVDDIGTDIRYRFKENGAVVDLSAAGIVVKFRFCSPDEQLVFDVTATAEDAANGLFKYVTGATHWQSQSGLWSMFPRAEISGSQAYRGEPKQINVNAVPGVTP